MRPLVQLMIASTLLLSGTSQASELFVGSYTEKSDQGIYRYRFDGITGRLEPLPLQTMPASNPSWLTFSPDRKQLFVVNEQAAGQVSAYTVDQDHNLTLLNQVDSGGGEPTHSSLSVDGRFLFVANYGATAFAGGNLSVFPVGDDGRLGMMVQQLTHAASKADPKRQDKPHVHSLVSSPDGQYVFASDLGADRVFSYHYDGSAPVQPLTPMDSVGLPAGSGPRHLLFAADGKHAWLTLEMRGEVALFDYLDERLNLRQTFPLTESSDPAAKAAGALHASRDGRFLYVSNRGTANELVVFAIDPRYGSLSFLQRFPMEGDHPREFALDPGENFVVVANQNSNRLQVIRRDPISGMLGEVVQSVEQPQPSDVKFLD